MPGFYADALMGVNSLYSSFDEPAEPARAIRRLLDDPEPARAMRLAGRRRMGAHFSWTGVAERTERVYAEAIADFRGA